MEFQLIPFVLTKVFHTSNYPKAGISILDDTLDIDWKIPTEHANLSDKDTKHAMLKNFDSPFDIHIGLYE